MSQTIYGDIYILINFSMDFLSLYILTFLTHDKVRLARMCIGAGIGAIYALLSLLPQEYEFLQVVTNILTSLTVCFAAFGFCSLRAYIKRVFLFYCVSFLSGGFMSAIYYFAGRLIRDRDVLINGRVEDIYADIPLWVFALCALVCALIAIIWGRVTSRGGQISVVTVRVESKSITHEFDGLVDSGNLLTDPLGGLPVIIVSAETADRLFPPEIRRGNIDVHTLRGCVRLIPYQTPSGEGMTLGYIAKRVEINGREVGAVLACPDGISESFEGHASIVPSCLVSR